ncbi:MAG TPA: response regulator transcription factor [Steroidobacteraceae bacterium]|nr:response regulator transcription factor [Steroidobacteraceae bacterium]
MSEQSAAVAPKRVLIADDHPLYCDALRAVVPQAYPDAEIAEAASQAEVLAAVVSDSAFDLVLLDLNLPGATRLSCLGALRRVAPTTPIVVVSAVDDPKIMQEVILGGASAYVPKSAPRQVLINALRATLAGGTYMPAEVVAALREAHAQGSDDLTSRQRHVLELLSKGLSNKQIARTLEISEITVKAHVSAIFRKLGVTSRVQAVIEARRRLDAHG